MPTVEQEIKAQFSKVFVKSDWSLFKLIAESHLERAVFVRKADMERIQPDLRLLARNIEKRLLIGIGTELLLKAVYLKHGFSINLPEKPDKNTDPPFPFTFQQIQGIAQASDKTYDVPPPSVADLFRIRQLLSSSSCLPSTARHRQRA